MDDCQRFKNIGEVKILSLTSLDLLNFQKNMKVSHRECKLFTGRLHFKINYSNTAFNLRIPAPELSCFVILWFDKLTMTSYKRRFDTSDTST